MKTQKQNKSLQQPRIALFHCGFIYSGGGERIVLEEARHLRKRGYKVEVYAPTLDPKRCFPQMVREIGVKTFLSTKARYIPGGYAFSMIASSLLAPILAKNFKDVDVFIGANQPGAWIAFCMARVLRKPYVIYLNQPNRVIYPRPVDREYGWTTTVKDYQALFTLFNKVFKSPLSWLDKLSITQADAVFVNGSYIAGVIENIYATKTTDAPAASYAYKAKDLRFKGNAKGTLTIGSSKITKPYALITNRHDPQKRFDFVLVAMARVIKSFPQAQLVIPGPFTDHTKKLKSLTKDLGIEGNVLFLGQVSESDLQKLYKHAYVYCYPSPEEDFGLGPIEAGGWGVPSVAWKHGGPTVTVEDGVTGFLAKPYDVKDYAEHMLTLFKNTTLRAKMGKASWKRTKEVFSWENHVDTIETFLKKLL